MMPVSAKLSGRGIASAGVRGGQLAIARAISSPAPGRLPSRPPGGSVLRDVARRRRRHRHRPREAPGPGGGGRGLSSLAVRSEYVHPLSQIVLERLQSRHGRWVRRTGLDSGLRLNEDGTFVLRFPDPGADGGGPPESGAKDVGGSIWTMYDPADRKHYLCLSRGGLTGRYTLQDNARPAWHSDRRSTPERVQDAVDEMIEKMGEVGVGGIGLGE